MAERSSIALRATPTGQVEAPVLAAIDRRLGRIVSLPGDWEAIDSVTGERTKSQDVLHRLNRSGWLVQVRRGAYVVRPRSGAIGVSVLELIGAISPQTHLVTAGRALSEAGLSDQSFRRVIVLVASRQKSWDWQGESVRYVSTSPTKIWGDRARAIGRFTVRIATPERAILDSLSRPAFGVTLGQIVEALDRALRVQSSFEASIARSAARFGSPFVARRLGFLVEQLAGQAASQNFTALVGRSQRIVPLLAGGPEDGPIDRRWRVRINVPFDTLARHQSES